MPHLKVRGMDKKALIENSKEIIDGLTEIIKCDRNWLLLSTLILSIFLMEKLLMDILLLNYFGLKEHLKLKLWLGNF